MKVRIIAWSLLALSTSAFAEKAPTYSYDQYKKMLTITGDMHWHNALLDLNKWNWCFAIAVVDGETHNPVIAVDEESPNWRFFDHAADSDGNQLNVLPGSRSVLTADTVAESFGIELTPDYVRTHRTTGMNIKIWGSGGEMILQIPPAAVTTFADGAIAIITKLGLNPK